MGGFYGEQARMMARGIAQSWRRPGVRDPNVPPPGADPSYGSNFDFYIPDYDRPTYTNGRQSALMQPSSSYMTPKRFGDVQQRLLERRIHDQGQSVLRGNQVALLDTWRRNRPKVVAKIFGHDAVVPGVQTQYTKGIPSWLDTGVDEREQQFNRYMRGGF